MQSQGCHDEKREVLQVVSTGKRSDAEMLPESHRTARGNRAGRRVLSERGSRAASLLCRVGYLNEEEAAFSFTQIPKKPCNQSMALKLRLAPSRMPENQRDVTVLVFV